MNADFLKKAGFEGEVLEKEPLSKHTYYKIGGPADILAVPTGAKDLEILSEAIRSARSSYFIMGAGSNLLVHDEGFRGVVIKTSKVNRTLQFESQSEFQSEQMNTSPGDAVLRVGASLLISMVLRRACQEGWGGLAFLTGIPGSVGGAVFMNAGTHLGETQGALQSATVFSMGRGQFVTLSGKELKYSYRKNCFLNPDDLVFETIWRMRLEAPEKVKAEIDETLIRRKATQPIDLPSCGSVFKNPKTARDPALRSSWAVLDRLGLRGHRVGGAQFSEKHCNFIVNHGGASAADVKALIDLAKTRALNELGVELEEEVRYLPDNLSQLIVAK